MQPMAIWKATSHILPPLPGSTGFWGMILGPKRHAPPLNQWLGMACNLGTMDDGLNKEKTPVLLLLRLLMLLRDYDDD